MDKRTTKLVIINGHKRYLASYVCEQCGKKFESRADWKNRFCSRECYYESMRGETLYPHICKTCGKEYKNPKRESTYCCVKCQNIGKYGKNHPLYKGGHIINDHGYEEVLNDREGYIPVHRKVVEDAIGRKLKRSEHIHHINTDIRDNRLENLVILTNSEHSRIHHYLRGNGHMTQAEYEAIINRGMERIANG